MAINEIRDTIQGPITIGQDGRGYMTRCINLKEGYRNEILSIDVYNDNVLLSNRLGAPAKAYQLFVSPYPIIPTTEELTLNDGGFTQFPNAGPMAGDEQVLYKEAAVSQFEGEGANQVTVRSNQFPSAQVAATPTTKWYSPHFYVTVLWWDLPSSTIDAKFSLFMRVNQKKASGTTVSMGQYKEFLDSQCRLLTSTAVVLRSSRHCGIYIPNVALWRY